jgi:AraC-like DNA-binding protein
VQTQDSQVTFVRDPDLAEVEARFSHYHQRVFRKHTHEAYAISLVRQGVTDFWCDNETRAVGPGYIALINPEQVHACNPRPGRALTYCMFYIEPALMQEIACDVFGPNAAPPRFRRSVIQDAGLWKGFTNLFTLMANHSDGLEKQVSLYDTLSRLVAEYTTRRAPPPPEDDASDLMQTARAHLLENITHNVPLDRLASLVNLSPYHFSRKFRATYGMPPHTYHLQQRIHLAKRMLARGDPIAQTALDTGFTDQSHFTKRFKAFVGTTPRQYQMAGR